MFKIRRVTEPRWWDREERVLEARVGLECVKQLCAVVDGPVLVEIRDATKLCPSPTRDRNDGIGAWERLAETGTKAFKHGDVDVPRNGVNEVACRFSRGGPSPLQERRGEFGTEVECALCRLDKECRVALAEGDFFVPIRAPVSLKRVHSLESPAGLIV